MNFEFMTIDTPLPPCMPFPRALTGFPVSSTCLLYTSNQQRILETYAKQNGFTNLRWYTDDGFSGANFQRPGFQAMLADIEAGKVGTVIVKDYCAIIGLNQKDLENQGILA